MRADKLEDSINKIKALAIEIAVIMLIVVMQLNIVEKPIYFTSRYL